MIRRAMSIQALDRYLYADDAGEHPGQREDRMKRLRASVRFEACAIHSLLKEDKTISDCVRNQLMASYRNLMETWRAMKRLS